MDRPTPTLARYRLLREESSLQQEPSDPKVRRYRLARIELNGRSASRERFAHLHRSYD